jgi:hypothetical protein
MIPTDSQLPKGLRDPKSKQLVALLIIRGFRDWYLVAAVMAELLREFILNGTQFGLIS